MSPEQVQGLPLDGRSDLYAVGAVLYELLVGRHYFDFSAMSPFEIEEFIVRGRPSPPSQFVPSIPLDLDALIMRLLEKDRDARFPDAGSVNYVLRKIAEREALRLGGVFTPVLSFINASARREGPKTRFQVRLEATNEGTAEANSWCGLTLHFPQLSDRGQLTAHDIRAWGSGEPLMHFTGDPIMGFGDDGKWVQFPAKHLMVECSVQKWSPGEHLHLEVMLLLNVSEIQVHARMWGSLKTLDGREIASNDPPWSSADAKDQQGFPCNVLVVGLKH
jgi:hypothetical protein